MGRDRRIITHNGVDVALLDLARTSGISPSVLRYRLAIGVRGDDLVSPARKQRPAALKSKPKRKSRSKAAIYSGNQHQMDMKPRDYRFEAAVARWNAWMSPCEIAGGGRE